MHTVHDLVRVGEAHAADFVIIKLIKAGGLSPASCLAAIVAAYAIRCTVVSTFDTQIGAAACLHLALAIGHPGHADELTVFEPARHGRYAHLAWSTGRWWWRKSRASGCAAYRRWSRLRRGQIDNKRGRVIQGPWA